MLKRLVLVTSFSLYFMLISAQIIGFAEIRDLKDSAVAAWSFEGNFKDMTDNGNDGKKLGKTTFVAGRFDAALLFSQKLAEELSGMPPIMELFGAYHRAAKFEQTG